jgi:hypothetical protein
MINWFEIPFHQCGAVAMNMNITVNNLLPLASSVFMRHKNSYPGIRFGIFPVDHKKQQVF